MDQAEFFRRMDRHMASQDRHMASQDRHMASIDRHMVSIDRHMVRHEQLVQEVKEEVALTREEVRLSREQRARSDALMDRLEARLDRDAEQHSDFRIFLRDTLLRSDRRWETALAESRRISEESRAAFERKMNDLQEESRAQRSALLRLLDRFDGPQPGGAAA